MENNMIFGSYDGDSAGRQAGRALLSDDIDEFKEVSNRIVLGHEIVKKWVAEHGGEWIGGGGDEGIFSVPTDAIASIEQLRKDYEFASGLTMTVGLGESPSKAGLALLVGKFRGKNQAVQYDPSIEDEIAQARERLEQGTASAEEQKLGEAYLNTDNEEGPMKHSEESPCPFCQDAEQESDPCPYCQEAESAENGGTDDCPYCQDMDREKDECPFCNDVAHDESQSATPDDIGGDDHDVEATAGPTVKNPTTTSGEDYEGSALNPPGIDKPNPEEEPKQGIASPAIYEADNQAQTPSNRALDVRDGTPFEHDSDTANGREEFGEKPEEILSQLDADGSEPSQEDAAVVEDMDDADMPVGDNAHENVSRPEDYEEDVPGDMGLGEEEQEQGPDLSGVLQEDLDGHADQMQKEKVIDMVSEALEGFKGCKPILEKAKEQAPQLYQSSLAMLRAMIEMAKMLGLSDGTESAEEAMGEEPAEAVPEEGAAPEMAPEEGVVDESPQQEEDTHDWETPFKPHPAHGQAAAQEDAAEEDPKLQSR